MQVVILFPMPNTLLNVSRIFLKAAMRQSRCHRRSHENSGVYLLDREMDADHNRCVITLVGEREAIQEAAIRGVGKAAELIDLTSTRARIRAWARRRGSLHPDRGRHP